MGTLFSTLDLGRAGLQVAQVQLDIAGNNIANVNKPGYSRQRVELTTRTPNYFPFGALGRGPAVAGVERLREGFLDTVYRQQVPGLGSAEVKDAYFGRMEDVFQEPGENGFSERFSQFFDAMSDFANDVESLPGREALLSEGDAMAAALRGAAGRIRSLKTAANEEVRNLVPEINSLADQVSQLNRTIRDLEISGNKANDSRDERDVVLDKLAKLVNITYRESDSGQVDVFLGGDPLVTGTRVRELKAEPVNTLDPERFDLVEVRFVDKDTKANITSGSIHGAIQIRDVELTALDEQLDTIAGSLIQSINRVHSQGNGLENLTGVTSTNMTLVAGTALTQLDPPFDLSNGSFQINVFDSNGGLVESFAVPVIATGPIGSQTTPQDIVDAINGSTNMTASIDGTGHLVITPASGFTFSFANDSSGALTALGVNGFFSGTDASTIEVSRALHDNPLLISSGYSTDTLETGDNSAALDMAALRTARVLENGTQTVQEYYQSMITRVGINTRTNTQQLQVQNAFVNQFEARRQQVSGVSIDEEVTNLIQYQRAFEASARVITIADNLLETLISIVR